MKSNEDGGNDFVWRAAWAWVRRDHEAAGLDAASRSELARWIAESPDHRANYDKACKLWLLVGMVPPANDVPIPGHDADLD